MQFVERFIRHILNRSIKLLSWICFSVFTGGIVGVIGAIFAKALNMSIDFRMENKYILLFLPFGGLFIVFIYKLFKYSKDGGTNLVLESIHSDKEVPIKMTPLIFISTVITQIFGGSAGREGAALQIGGSIGNFLGKILKINVSDKKIFIMSGMSAGFSALFGTPIAAAIFSIEVVNIGTMQYSALVPCAISSLFASAVATRLGVAPERFFVDSNLDFSSNTAIITIIFACACAILSTIFCEVLKGSHKFFDYFFKNQYMKILVGSILIIFLTILLRSFEYSGTGIHLIELAIDGKAKSYDFMLKILFTSITLACGFKGGEIVPSFCVGATFGCLFGNLVGISPQLFASIGMVAVFCSVTNCPISSLLISLELFGLEFLPFYFLAISISYMLSGYYGLYKSQKFKYSKYGMREIDDK